MKRILRLASALLIAGSAFQLQGQDLYFNKLSTYETGVFDDGAAEISAYDATTQRLFIVNAGSGTIDIIDISNPGAPSLHSSITLSFGEAPNSVAVNNGIVAVAVEASVKQDQGKVILFDTDGNFIEAYGAGALPDMVTFSPDGNKIVVANEGEPNDDYTVDPEGSVTVVDISGGADAGVVSHIAFDGLNDRKASLLNKGVRIFGPNATVAQDLEPEYVAILDDNATAYVSCQENNAMVVVDIVSGTVIDVLALGFKDHSRGTASVETYNLNELANWPTLGTPVYDGGQDPVSLGGFSGIYFDEANSTSDDYVFYAIPDRGPNDSPVAKAEVGTAQNLRPFKLPDYQSRIVKFRYSPSTGVVSFDPAQQIMLTHPDGTTPISGKGNVPGVDEVPVTYTDVTTAFSTVSYTDADGEEFHELAYDRYGGDFEGIVVDKNGEFWMCDEYRPAIYHFDANGVMVDRFVASGTAALADATYAESVYGPNAVSGCLDAGFYGTESLPAVYAKRWANRGFEALAYDADNDLLYAFIQSPMYNPNSSTKNNSDVIRILAIDMTGTPVAEYVYVLDGNRVPGLGLRLDKIGDAVYVGNGKIMVIERDSSAPENDDKDGRKYIFEIDLNHATNILNLPISSETDAVVGTLEMMTADEIMAAGITPVFKSKMLNLNTIGYFPSDKAEGLALLTDGSIAVMNDNDFGLAGAGQQDESQLGIIKFDSNYGMDASNKDDIINITNWPTRGLYMPDAMVSYVGTDGETYILTANEGDSRDYDGYSEEERVADLTLNPAYFNDIVTLQEDANLGRIKTTVSEGDLDNDGTYEYIYTYGARSFSVWNSVGSLVYDSGDDFEQTIATVNPDDFNSTNDENGSFDNRSDDKGPEPEAITVATINGKDYAFIGMERHGGIMIYEITDIKNPVFVDYLSDRNFSEDAQDANGNPNPLAGDLAPEDIKIIPASDAPWGQTIMVVANEVSGTVALWTITDVNVASTQQNDVASTWNVYPNPTTTGTINLTKISDFKVFNTVGQELLKAENTSVIDVSAFSAGIYFVQDISTGEVQKFEVK